MQLTLTAHISLQKHANIVSLRPKMIMHLCVFVILVAMHRIKISWGDVTSNPPVIYEKSLREI